jgi:hypothetical protein
MCITYLWLCSLTLNFSSCIIKSGYKFSFGKSLDESVGIKNLRWFDMERGSVPKPGLDGKRDLCRRRISPGEEDIKTGLNTGYYVIKQEK